MKVYIFRRIFTPKLALAQLIHYITFQTAWNRKKTLSAVSGSPHALINRPPVPILGIRMIESAPFAN